jgi:ribosomal-protein-alanine N-acetyltransferase
MTIEPATAAHGEVLAALHLECFGDAWPADNVVSMLTTPGAFGFIALLDETPVGFVVCRTAGDECELLSIGVIPVQRRTGLGRGLWESAISEAKNRVAGNLYLEVAEDNLAAISFYISHGCTKYGLRKSYYRRPAGRVDGLLFRLALT